MLRKAAAARATVPSVQRSAPPTAEPTQPGDGDGAAPDDHGAQVESADEADTIAASSDSSASDQADVSAAAADGAPSDGSGASDQAADEPAAGEPADDAAASEQAASDASAGGDQTAATADPAVEAVATACGVQGDRAMRLLEALDIVGGDIDRVRLVRVYQGEKGPHNAVSRGEFHYVIDRVAGPARGRRDSRTGRGGERGGRGGERADRGGGGGGGGAGGSYGGGDRKPRGLGSLKFGAPTEAKDPRDDRPGRGEMPRAGIGWQLTSTPRTFADSDRGPGRGRGPGGRGPRGRDRNGPGGRDRNGPGGRDRNGPGGRGHDRGFRDPQRSPVVSETSGADHSLAGSHSGGMQPPRPPRLGPDGQPLPPRSKRPRKPIGPDEKGLGPDGTPWDPERRTKRLAEQTAKLNTPSETTVELPPSPPAVPAPPEKTE